MDINLKRKGRIVMAFLDKLNSLAKNVGEKTNDVIEINRMNSKISNEKSAIEEQQKKIGEYYYNQHAQGEQLDEGVLEFCAAIDASNQVIKENEEAIQNIKDERETQKQEAAEVAAAAVAEKEAQKEAAKNEPGGITCSSCGNVNQEGMKFCSQCGNKLEIEVEIEVVEAEIVEEPVKKVCPDCNIELPPNAGFCTQCGKRVD